MNKPKIPSIFITALIVTNAITGVGWWRSHERVKYVEREASVFANESTRYLQEVRKLKQSLANPQSSVKYREISF